MAKFVFILNDITNEQFQKVIAIQTKSGEHVKFIPQAVPFQPGSSVPGTVGSNALTTVPGLPPNQTHTHYANFRLEWTHEGIHFAKEILEVFATPKEQKAD